MLTIMYSASHCVTVRPEQPTDEAFLLKLYASTRQEELDAWGWPPEMRTAFLNLQFRASQAQHQAYPEAEFLIVLVDDANAGRMIIHRTADSLHLVDIALLPRYHNAGLGTALLQRVFGESIGAQKPLRLQVRKGNRAERLYFRLGFTRIGETELHWEMEWRAPVAPPAAPLLSD